MLKTAKIYVEEIDTLMDNTPTSSVILNKSDVTMEGNVSHSEDNMTSFVEFYVSASDQRFRSVVNAVEVYWTPVIFILGASSFISFTCHFSLFLLCRVSSHIKIE